MAALISERGNNAARLFGYDIFVSFALGPPPRGSRSYASDLARRLREREFTVFFSEEEAAVGDHLDDTLRRALLRSRILVVITNRGTLADPRWVRTEVEEFRCKHPERPIIPVNIGGALQDAALSAAAEPWLRFSDKIWIDESQSAGDEGIVSDSVLDRLVTAPNAMRSRTRWRWTVRAAFAVLSIVTASALWFAWSDRQNAQRAAFAAEEARNNAGTAQRNATTARANEERARQNESRALTAEDQARQEAEAARKAERIAQSGRLAAESQLARASDARLALLLATEAWRLEPTTESRRALYEALHEPVAIPLISGGSHLESWKAVDYSADGRFIAGVGDSTFVASVGDGQLVRIWEAETRHELSPFRAGGRIHEIAFSPDGRTLAAATATGLHLWNMTTREPIGEPLMTPRNVSAVAWSRDGRVLAFAGPTGIVLWDPKLKAAIGEPLHPEGDLMVSKLSFNDRGSHLAVVQFDSIQLWEIATRSPQKEPLRSGGFEPSVLYFSNEGVVFTARELRPGFSRYQVALANISSGHREIGFIDENEIRSLAYARAAALFATGSEDGAVRLWEGSFTRPLHTPLYGHNAPVTGLAFTPDGTRLVARSYNRLVQWMLNTGFHRFRRSGPTLPSRGGADDMIVSKDGHWLVLLRDHERVEWYELPAVRTVGSATVPNGWQILAVDREGTIALRTTSSPTNVTLHPRGTTHARCAMKVPASAAVFSPDGGRIATWTAGVGADRTVHLWRTSDCRQTAAVSKWEGDDEAAPVAFSFDGGSLFVAVRGGIRRWNIAAGRFDRTVLNLPGAFAIAGDAQGQFLASAHGNTIAVVRLGSRTPPVLLGTRTFIWSLAFSPDGLWLASVGNDAKIVLWDLTTNQPVGSPIGTRQGPLRSVAFTRDGSTLVTTGGVDGPPELWHIAPETWASKACRLAQRNFTCSEWQRALGAEPYRKTCPVFSLPEDAAGCTTTPVLRSKPPRTD